MHTNASVWVVFHGNAFSGEYYLANWKLASPKTPRVWPLTNELLVDFVFQNGTLFAYIAKGKEIVLKKYELGNKFQMMNESRIVLADSVRF